MMIKFYDVIISMGYIPDIEVIRAKITIEDHDLRSAFSQALNFHGYNLAQAKKLVIDFYNNDPVRLNFLLGYIDHGVMNYILEIANMHREFYPITRKLINQYLYNLSEDIFTLSYIEFRRDNVVRFLFLQDETDKFITMVRQSPILNHIYYVDADSKVRSPEFGVARSNLLLQSEAFKYETAEMFSKIRDLGRADIGQMDMIEIPYEGNVMRAIRKDEALRALKAANSV